MILATTLAMTTGVVMSTFKPLYIKMTFFDGFWQVFDVFEKSG